MRVRQRGQRRTTASPASSRRRTAGSEGAGGGPGTDGRRRRFPPQPQVLEEGEGDHGEQGVVMQPQPGAALEVVEPQLVFELLVRLLAAPARLDRRGELSERGRGGGVREVVLLLAR